MNGSFSIIVKRRIWMQAIYLDRNNLGWCSSTDPDPRWWSSRASAWSLYRLLLSAAPLPCRSPGPPRPSPSGQWWRPSPSARAAYGAWPWPSFPPAALCIAVQVERIANAYHLYWQWIGMSHRTVPGGVGGRATRCSWWRPLRWRLSWRRWSLVCGEPWRIGGKLRRKEKRWEIRKENGKRRQKMSKTAKMA